ncbi:unnamed protein product [Paramecium primaurelia]|uniref:Uncharacterized protein n=1 Tax=Paramecium primaurelia TaxID=5886 RepID=A0A8S1QQK2_PARPR|nr:unnamed protein product [Paramecium primaurelia]CAD8118643.1 unnamed protein product [Paramecium primaurelia]
MSKSQKEDNLKSQIETEREDKKICGIVNFTFKFREGEQLEYKVDDCLIENHYLIDGDSKDFICPDDLNINYCYLNEQGEQIQLDVEDYEIDNISDLDSSFQQHQGETSFFFVQYMVISPNHQFIFLCVDIKMVNQKESYRMIVIDIKNQEVRKQFYINYFIGQQKPQFSNDGNVAIIDISKNEKGSRYLFFDLQNDCQNVSIFQFDQHLLRIEYDEKSKCFFYIQSDGEIIKQPINFEDYTIDQSKCQKFQICPILNKYLDYNIRFYLLYDSIGLLLDDYGLFIIIRMGENCKVLRNYNYESYRPVYILNKAFVIASDYDKNILLFIDILKGKLIRKSEFTQRPNKYQYYYPPKKSYYISYLFYSPQEENSDFEDWNMMRPQLEKRYKWIIFDVIRGIEKEVNKTILTQDDIKRSIFTHDFVAQTYKNKVSFQLKL